MTLFQASQVTHNDTEQGEHMFVECGVSAGMNEWMNERK